MLGCSLCFMAYPSSPAITKRDIQGNALYQGYNQAATLTTSLTGSNNDLTYTSVDKAAASNGITVRYVVAGNSTALSVSVTGSAITVNVATDSGGAATSTAAQVAAAVAASGPASALVTVENAPSNNGTGVVTALAATSLTSGTSRRVAAGSAATARVSQRGNPTRARLYVG